MRFSYHYSYQFENKNVKLYGDGVFDTDEEINRHNYHEIKEKIYEVLEYKHEIGDYTNLHIVNLSRL